MAASRWIQSATQDIKERGTEGSFRRIAKKMQMSTHETASHIMENKDRYSPAVRKKANFALNVTR